MHYPDGSSGPYFQASRFHENLSRTLQPVQKAQDHLKMGSDPHKVKQFLKNWFEKRMEERSVVQCYEGEFTPEGSVDGCDGDADIDETMEDLTDAT